MSTPDFMPTIKSGCHDDPSEGACVMEYVSFITGGEFTDLPTCTPYHLALLAQNCNDAMSSDEERARLLTPLIPRLLGAGQDKEYDKRLRQFLIGLCIIEDPERKVVLGYDHRAHVYTVAVTLAGIRFHKATGNSDAERGDEAFQRIYNEVNASVLTDALDDYDLYLKREKPADLTPVQVHAVERLTALITS